MTLSRDARARAVQLPAWNEALGLPRPWDQQWSLRIQQVLAFETDLLEYPTSSTARTVVEGLVATSWTVPGRDGRVRVGEAVAAVESGYLKSAGRLARSVAAGSSPARGGGRGQQVHRDRAVALTADAEGGRAVDPAVEADAIEAVQAWRERRDPAAVDVALDELRGRRRRLRTSWRRRSPPPGPAHHRRVGAHAARGLRRVPRADRRRRGQLGHRTSASSSGRGRARPRGPLGRRLRILVGKPGLDGHSNGAEQIAVRSRDAGMEVIYQGIRLTP